MASRTEVERGALVLDDWGLRGFAQIVGSFGQENFGYVVTPNVDHLIRWHDDDRFRAAYQDACYTVLDSRVLSRLLRVFKGLTVSVCTGSDLTAQVFRDILRCQDGVVLVGGTEMQAQALRETYGLKRLQHYSPPMGFVQDPREIEKAAEFVEANSPFRFCFLAVGSPQQEFLAQQLKLRGHARGLALCVGASIDFLTGAEKRAPRSVQLLGLEWAYRLARRPRRLAQRYLVRGPRIFGLLGRTKVSVRPQWSAVVSTSLITPCAPQSSGM